MGGWVIQVADSFGRRKEEEEEEEERTYLSVIGTPRGGKRSWYCILV